MMKDILISLFVFSSSAFDCFGDDRLPLHIGCGSADTEITSFAIEGSSIYFGGYSKCSDYIADTDLSSQGTFTQNKNLNIARYWLEKVTPPNLIGSILSTRSQ